LTGAATFLSSSSSFILTRAEWTPFQTHCYSENLVAPGIEAGTSELAARNSDHYLSETGSVSLLRREVRDTVLGRLQRGNLNLWTETYIGYRMIVGIEKII
jgi:hypothetical protein